MSKEKIMCDYDDSVLTWGRLGSHLGSSYDSNRLLLIMSRTARKGQPHFHHFPSSCMKLWQFFFFFNVLHVSHQNGTKVIASPSPRVSHVKQHFQPVARFSPFYRRSTRFVFKVAIISHLHWHLQSDEGEVKSLRWLIIISKVPCHAADLNKRVWSSICMHLYAWAKRLIS